MDVYTLDPLFARKEIIDYYRSIVWTERYSDAGDFTLVVPYSSAAAASLADGTFLSIDGTKEVMIVDTLSNENGDLTVTGSSLTAFLQQRMLRDSWANNMQYFTLKGAPGWIAGEAVRQMCVAGGYMDQGYTVTDGSYEVIPNLVIGATATGTSVTIGLEYGNVYDAVKKVCDSYNLGFSLYLDSTSATSYVLKFKTYAGKDLTSDQSTNPAVIFDPALDSLTNVKELKSSAGYKNVAYAWAPNIQAQNYTVGSAYADSLSKTQTGFKRRTLMVLADDINAADLSTTSGADDLQAILNQRAKDALANNNYVRLTDGELVPQDTFKYSVDYNLGDIIELRGLDHVGQDARITEYIRSQDSTGYRAYPTLTTIS